MNYILVAISAWALFGIVSVLEKFLLDKPIHNSTVYTFYTGFFALFTVIIFVPFAKMVPAHHLLFDLSCGLIYLIGQYCLFTAIMKDEISRVVPVTGALTPIFSLLIVNYGLHQSLSKTEVYAFALLVLGTFLISYRRRNWSGKLFWPLLAAFFLALYFSLVKNAYTPFAANYAWVRIGSVIGALLMVIHPDVRAEIVRITKGIGRSSNKGRTSGLFVSKEVVGGLGFIILNYALSVPRNNPAIINSLQGFEFVVVLFLAVILSRYFPKVLKEKISKGEVFQKVMAIVLLFAGLIILEIYK